MTYQKPSFSIIRKFNSPKEAVTADGFTVYRQDKLWIETEGRFVACAPDDQHFCYIDPSNKIGRWSPMCTCGSMAGIYGYNAYAKHASPTTRFESTVPGELVVCIHYIEHGKHADGSH